MQGAHCTLHGVTELQNVIFFYTELIFHNKFYPMKSVSIATNLIFKSNKVEIDGFLKEKKNQIWLV